MTADAVVLAVMAFGFAFTASAQTPDATGEMPASQPAPAHGKVIFSRQAPPGQTAEEAVAIAAVEAQTEPGPPDRRLAVPVANDERAVVLITSLRLDVHLTPASAREEVRAELMLRNAGTAPLTRLPMQLSSTLRWQSVSTRVAGGVRPLTFTQAPIATDADHTGYAQEVVITPAVPLQPGKELTIAVFYSGTIAQTGARLELIGAPPAKANAADWDAIQPTTDQAATALRGFGDVLWYPVAAPAAGFGETNRLFELIRRQRRLNAAATIALRLTVEYVGDPPVAAIFDSALEPLIATPDQEDQLVANTHGIATAEFAQRPVGFRAPSLFLTAQQPFLSEGQLLRVITANPDAITPYAEAAGALATQLTAWLGAGPSEPLTLLDHAGEPFEDGSLIVARLSPEAAGEAVAPELVRGLTHGWFNPQEPESAWLNFGVAELMGLIATENLLGRDRAIKQLEEAYVLLALSERAPSAAAGVSSSDGTQRALPSESQKPAAGPIAAQPLPVAYSDTFLRFKSLAVLWQLREQLGEEALQKAFITYRRSLSLDHALAADVRGFEHALERSTGKDLAWFFADWVYTDPGLPDLSFGAVNARTLPATGGRGSGYLVAVEVRNDGGAAADVPVTVRNENLTATERIRVAAHASASVRIVFEGVPRSVQVNDGSVPEVGALIHIHELQ